MQTTKRVWVPAEAAVVALEAFRVGRCRGRFPQQSAHIVGLTTAARCHQQLKPFLSRVIAQLCVPRSTRKQAMLKSIKIDWKNLSKCYLDL